MYTKPMDEYLDRERLTDLAQFAVPQGHDLWPRIERAVRRSAAGIAAPARGLLPLGLSRARTPAGALLISATFAVLGVGLTFLVLSGGQNEAPPAMTEAAVTPTALSSSAPVHVAVFRDSLSSRDVARFQALPAEIQDALEAESLENGNENALRYLRGMPDDPAPLAEILEPDARKILDALGEPYRRQLLLEGYPHATIRHLEKQWQAGEISDIDYRFGHFESMVRHVYETLSEDGGLLPPIEQSLSPTALARFEALHPLMKASFRQMWETTRSPSPEDTVEEMEQKLLNTPLEMPGVRDLGLPAEDAGVLEREPGLWGQVQRTIAANLVLDQEWGSEGVAELQRRIEAYQAPRGREALSRGLVPGGRDPWFAMACEPPELGLVPLEDAIPGPFRNVHPSRFVYSWPAPGDALSGAALENLELLDKTMRDALDYWWYGQGPIPMDVRFMSCLVAMWDRGVSDTPFTSMPAPSVYLSPDNVELFSKFSEYGREVIERDIAEHILRGEVSFKREQTSSKTEHVSTFYSTPAEFLEGLRFYADQRVSDRAWRIEELDCSHATPSSSETDETDQDQGVAPPLSETPSAGDSWVSENGFIQFTTAEGPIDEPLPGTHPWCIDPSTAPDQTGPWLVPSDLPYGMEQTARASSNPRVLRRTFRSGENSVAMTQSLCKTWRLDSATYKTIQAGDHTTYVTAGLGLSADGSALVFDPDDARSLVMDIGYGVISFNVVLGSVTVDDLVSMAGSLVPEELTDAEKGPYPQAVLDTLKTRSFGTVYVPSKLPDGYQIRGQLRYEPLGDRRTSRLSYRRTRGNDCPIYLRQAARGQRLRYIPESTVEIEGVTLHTTLKPPVQPSNQVVRVYFQAHDVWFEVMMNLSPACDHSLEMVAEIAAGLEPLQP